MQMFERLVWPVLGAVALGAAWLRGDRSRETVLTSAGLRLFVPALILAHVPEAELLRGGLVVLLLGSVVLLLVVGLLAGRLLGLAEEDRLELGAAAAFANFGYFGLPVVHNALGARGLDAGLAVLLILNLPTTWLGLYLATPRSAGSRQALVRVAREPLTWVVAIALVMGLGGLRLPSLLQRPAALLGEAAIPTMLLVLGGALTRIRPRAVPWRGLIVALLLRLVAAPLLVRGLAGMLGLELQAPTTAAALLQLATPVGMTPLLFFAAAGRRTDLLAAAILLSTPLAGLTLPMVAAILLGLGSP